MSKVIFRKLPEPVGVIFNKEKYDFGTKEGLAIKYSRGNLMIRNAIRLKDEFFNEEIAKQMLLRWFWRRLGAA